MKDVFRIVCCLALFSAVSVFGQSKVEAVKSVEEADIAKPAPTFVKVADADQVVKFVHPVKAVKKVVGKSELEESSLQPQDSKKLVATSSREARKLTLLKALREKASRSRATSGQSERAEVMVRE
ncbi:MAG TPA: hypothetical protein PKV71_10600 [Calditrichia bacterium]|nr:hypothetical protein [Calditrichota bacterium]HQU72385.1 hypothetical protein [Calditrichia bacterium]HQV32318.1 hypothetical protein [Calditrichia bacterium]